MKLFAPAALLAVATASNLPSVREDDTTYVPPLYAMIAKCVEYITFVDDDFWDANCMEYCWHMAHHPDSCGLTETVQNYDTLIDCVLKRHGSVCATTRPSRAPIADEPATSQKVSSAAATSTSASVETREAWKNYCQEYVYNAENEEWHDYCKQLCEHYSKNGWLHCWNSQSEHEYAKCVSNRHAECTYWNVVDPTPQDECAQKIYHTHGMGCMDYCKDCTGETVDEVYECAVSKGQCKTTLYAPEVIPSPSVASKSSK